jgi:hypothetical protein
MSGGFVQQKARSQLSDNGKLRLNVNFRSTVDQQSGEESRWKQPVFSLEEVETGKTWWVREGNWRNESGIELFVSDEGWSVIRVHRRVPRLLVVTPEGSDTLSVEICFPTKRKNEEPPAQAGTWERWTDEHVRSIFDVGTVWTVGARFRFAREGLQTFFVCRTGWGRYLVLDLSAARVVSEAEASPELLALLRPVDQQWALEILKQVIAERAALELAIENAEGVRLSPPEMDDLYDNLEIALRIVRQENVKRAKELLVVLQDFHGPVWERGVYPALEMNGGRWHYDPAREWIHLTMFVIGVKPRGLAFRWFGEVHGEAEVHFRELPECIPNRDQILKSLKPGMTFDSVIRSVGAPSAILGSFELGDKLPHEEQAQYERWDYDELGADGKPHSWGLTFKLSQIEPVHQDPTQPWSHPFRFKTTDECTPALHSVKRIRWTKAYREMREGRY